MGECRALPGPGPRQSGGVRLTARAPAHPHAAASVPEWPPRRRRARRATGLPSTKPGAYRVEVFLYRYRLGRLCSGAKPWIFSNPIYLRPAPRRP